MKEDLFTRRRFGPRQLYCKKPSNVNGQRPLRMRQLSFYVSASALSHWNQNLTHTDSSGIMPNDLSTFVDTTWGKGTKLIN